MANFLQALNLTLAHEGGYANDSADKGGETYQGIARNYHPDWLGWGFLDNVLNKAWNQTWAELNGFVADFYYQEYWLKNNLDQVESNEVANVMFDWLVNSGGAKKEIQRVLNNMGVSVVVDGAIGPLTITAVNAVHPISLVNAITAARVDYYKTGEQRGWFDSKFLAGLISRAEQYTITAVETVGKHQA